MLSAANSDLLQAIREGTFRGDLYHRLRWLHVSVPALKERADDIPLLAAHFLKEEADANMAPPKALSAESMRFLVKYSWPGNVRELRRVIGELFAVSTANEIPLKDAFKAFPAPTESRQPEGERYFTLRDRMHLENALASANWNLTKAAQSLRRHRNTVRMQMKRMGLKRPHASGTDLECPG